MTTAARARRYDALQLEAAQDERREIESKGGVAPHLDGSHKTVVQNRLIDDGTVRRARCSCGFEGTDTRDYAVALTEFNSHRRSHR